MIKVLILDDQKAIAQSIKTLLEKFFVEDFKQIDLANDVAEALRLHQKSSHDLLLFDVNLGDKLSFDFFKDKSNDRAKVIFITGFDKYAIPAIKHNCIDYILKPINLNEFKISIQKAIDLITKENRVNYAHQFIELQDNVISLKTLEQMRLVKIHELVYLAAEGAYTAVFLNNDEKILIAKNLKDFESKLLDFGFIRIHHSYLVNALKIKSLIKKDGFFVEMTHGEKLMVSTRKKDAVLHFIEKFLEV